MRDLESHLEPLRRRGLISRWHDGCITPGEEWEPLIKHHLDTAQIILLLISAKFISSQFCYEVELKRAMERHNAGEAWVIPIILKPCLWQEVPVGDKYLQDLQALPKDAKPVTRWDDLDEALTHIAEALASKIREWHAKVEQEQQQQAHVTTGLHHLEQGNYTQAIAELEQAQQLGHPTVGEPLAQARALLQQQRERDERQRAEAARLQKQQDYYQGGLHHLDQGNYAQAIADFEQARQYGHPDAGGQLAEAKRRQAAEDNLSSEKGIDYTRLRDWLKAGDWMAADQETTKQMLKAMGKAKWWDVEREDLLKFPCADLQTLDRLWVKYSQGRFGFSVQKQIYVDCGAKLDGQYPGDKIWEKFCDRIGWRVTGSYISYSQVTFSTSAPEGHLPIVGVCGVGWGVFLGFSSLAYRLVNFSTQ